MIKRTPADAAFSKLIRQRSGYRCQRCGAQHDETSVGLHCSHYVGRGNWAVRFDPDNAFALCYGCHQFVGARPQEHTDFVLGILGQGAFDLLTERKNDKKLGRWYRKTGGKGEIAKFFRDQLDKHAQIERFF